jgi:hypothetical protein
MKKAEKFSAFFSKPCHSEERSDEESPALEYKASDEILRGVYPEFIEGLRMTFPVNLPSPPTPHQQSLPD